MHNDVGRSRDDLPNLPNVACLSERGAYISRECVKDGPIKLAPMQSLPAAGPMSFIGWFWSQAYRVNCTYRTDAALIGFRFPTLFARGNGGSHYRYICAWPPGGHLMPFSEMSKVAIVSLLPRARGKAENPGSCLTGCVFHQPVCRTEKELPKIMPKLVFKVTNIRID